MEYDKPDLSELKNESDVEQKFIYPLLVASMPSGFGITSASIVTKANVRRFEIDKGAQKKLYYPDYVVTFGGFPLAIVEGKGPDVNLDEAYREARLYAAELNGLYETGFNPVKIVCATNATSTWIGYADRAKPVVKLAYDDVDPYKQQLTDAQNILGIEALEKTYVELRRFYKPIRYSKPRRIIGGLAVQQEEVGYNSFGAKLSAELGHIFNPTSRQDRLRIARDGYVSSTRRDRYVAPIDQVIRAATPLWQTRSTLIRDPSQPSELFRPFENPKDLEHRILLLVGERGAGKTTFLYHLQAVALPQDVRHRTIWIHMDVNTAPVVKEEIYKWVREEIIAGIKLAHPEINFDAIDVIQKVFSVEVNRFNRGLGSLLVEGSKEKNFELYKLLLQCQSDLHQTAVCYTRHFGSERGLLVVVVFDNADKKPRDEQLLMFEVAQWLQREFRVLVVLPIREETYDNHRSEPPLDTALKDLVFRIEPPLFQHALVKRVQIALNEIAQGEAQRSYDLSNGFRITYAETERSYYITSIVTSIFEYDSYVRRLIIGLAGNDLRRVFEIFVEFCTSGHIGESEILRMRQSKGEYILPLDVVMTVLLRANRRYYDSDSSILKNILDLDEKDDQPTHFSRFLILSWLHSRFNQAGPNGLKGYFSLGQLSEELAIYGLSSRVVRREVNYLVKSDCLIAESLKEDDISEADLVKIGPVGFVHLELLGVAEYWSALAEDTNFRDAQLARRIADRIVNRELHYTHAVSIQNGRALFEYIRNEKEATTHLSEAFLSKSRFASLTNIDVADSALLEKTTSTPGGVWFEAIERFRVGHEFDGTVVNAVHGVGLFVEISPGLTGLLHQSRLSGGSVTDVSPKTGDKIRVRVDKIEPDRRRLSLTLPARTKKASRKS